MEGHTVKSSKLRMLMLTAIAVSPLASAPAFAQGDGGRGWTLWQRFVAWYQTGGGSGGYGGHGGGTPLPSPGALGLVVVGLGTAVVLARRRQPVRVQ
jgi:hypothetical protein